MNIEEFKNKLSDIRVIQSLPIAQDIEKNITGEVRDLFSDGYSFTLKDGCDVKLSKVDYKCAQEDMAADTEIYAIHSKYNTIFKCFTCGNLLTSRNDLLRIYDTDKIVTKEILFPICWNDEKIVGYIEEFIYMMTSGNEK